MALFTWRTPQIGDKRVVKRFLLVPWEFGNEARWLGRERIVQTFQSYRKVSPGCPIPFQACGWRYTEWAE